MKATDGDFTRLATDSRTLLARRHRNSPDFEVENVGESILKEKTEVDHMLGNFNIVLGCIAGAALIVGGIGILSLMLIAVNERLFEIGTRKAVGATDGEIMLQFLVESATLSSLGALIGTILAVIATKLMAHNFPMGLAISTGGLALALRVRGRHRRRLRPLSRLARQPAGSRRSPPRGVTPVASGCGSAVEKESAGAGRAGARARGEGARRVRQVSRSRGRARARCSRGRSSSARCSFPRR